jgi:hypothetical protein
MNHTHRRHVHMPHILASAGFRTVQPPRHRAINIVAEVAANVTKSIAATNTSQDGARVINRSAVTMPTRMPANVRSLEDSSTQNESSSWATVQAQHSFISMQI